ncbi:MAG: hypothetical protein D6735_12145 [Acidobacteria bacterium]|nr:MAG: hypothetical protein D6735_12145 [Acidobacteriota bacterium]
MKPIKVYETAIAWLRHFADCHCILGQTFRRTRGEIKANKKAARKSRSALKPANIVSSRDEQRNEIF